MVPAAGSGVPGAPADWEPPDGIEQHTPVLFLDLNADDLSTGNGRRTYSEKQEYLSINHSLIILKRKFDSLSKINS